MQCRHLYMERGASHLGCSKPFRANQCQVKRFGLAGPSASTKPCSRARPTLMSQLHQLSDIVLLCHCEISDPCHGDVLIKAWEEKFLNGGPRDTVEEAGGAEELLRAAGLRETGGRAGIAIRRRTGTRSPRLGVERPWPPLMTGRGTKAREMHDGASLCSPGRWPPEQRKLPENAVLTELQTC